MRSRRRSWSGEVEGMRKGEDHVRDDREGPELDRTNIVSDRTIMRLPERSPLMAQPASWITTRRLIPALTATMDKRHQRQIRYTISMRSNG